MPMITLDLPAGLYRQGTKYQSKGHWYEAQLVRFLEDTVRPIGGWTRMSESTVASLYAFDYFTADPGNISADYTTSAYVSDRGWDGWDVAEPSSAQLEPDPSTHLAFPVQVSADWGFHSRSAVAFSDFQAYMDVKWTSDPEGTTSLGMYVRANSTHITTAGAEGWLFAVDIDPGIVTPILDTFTGGLPTDANSWTGTPTGQTYSADTNAFRATDLISSPTGAGVMEQNQGTIQPRDCWQDTNGAAHNIGDEVYVDMYHATGHSGGANNMGFYCMADNTGLSCTDYYLFYVQFSVDTAQVHCARRATAAQQSTSGGGAWSFPQTTWLRLGVTINSADEYQVWTEPAGGGTRTNRFLWQPTPDVQYDYLGDAAQGYLGMYTQAAQFVTGQRPCFDNLTLQASGGGTQGNFSIYAYRVVNAVQYEVGFTTGVEFPWSIPYDYSDGFRFGVDMEGSEAKAWYEGFDGTSQRKYLDWDGQAVDTPLDLTTSAGGSVDDYADAGHQYTGIFRDPGDTTAGTNVYAYYYQQLGFSGPFDLEGIPRGALGWEQFSTGYVAFGTTEKLYVYSIGYLYDITASGFTQGNEDTTTSDENSGRYGKGPYGKLTYGTGQQGIVEQIDADIWHMDTFEDSLMSAMVPSDKVLYEWNPDWGGTSPALAVTVANGYAEDAPAVGRGIVVTPERFMVILGPDGNNRDIRWASRETIDIWTEDILDPSNTAGSYTLEGKGRCMKALAGRGETIIWTDTDVFAMTYIAGEFIYGFEKRGSACGLISPLAVAAIDNGFVWMGLRGFYTYDGYTKPLDCPIQDAIFRDVDQLQRVKIAAVVNQAFGEVWWFYPSIATNVDDPGECDRYAIWNYMENLWTMGELERTCGVEASSSAKNPLMLSPQGYAYNHEVGWLHPDEAGDDITPYVESGPIEFGDGDNILHGLKLIPDERNLGDVQGYFYGSFWPMEDEVLYGPYTMVAETDVRITARSVRVRLEQVSGTDWRVGKFRFDSVPGGKR